MSEFLLDIENLKTHFTVRMGNLLARKHGVLRAVDGVSLHMKKGEVLGLVGESGCGKSTLARTVVRLIPPTEGAVRFDGMDLTTLSPSLFRKLRPRMQMIFQDPYASLNPRRTVYDTLAEPMLAHAIHPRKTIPRIAGELMEKTGLSRRDVRKYPHEFSGGQRQRIAIARAIALQPSLILADEPVSALDVSVQAQILNLLRALQKEMGLTLMLISHDLAVVRYMSQRIAVMYFGKIVELGTTNDVFAHPLHPYTRALIRAVPVPDPPSERITFFSPLKGDPPSPLNPPTGCPFHPRCPHATNECQQNAPILTEHFPHHTAACLHVNKIHTLPI